MSMRKVWVMTSSPGSTPAAATAIWRAAVPLLVAKQYFVPNHCAQSSCSAVISGGATETPLFNTAITACLSSSVTSGQARPFQTEQLAPAKEAVHCVWL